MPVGAKAPAAVVDEHSEAGLKLAARSGEAILGAVSERNGEAESGGDHGGHLGPDGELCETENVPVSDDVESFVEREVKPHVADAWIYTTRRDLQGGRSDSSATRSTSTGTSYEYRARRADGATQPYRRLSRQRDGGSDRLGPGNGSRAGHAAATSGATRRSCLLGRRRRWWRFRRRRSRDVRGPTRTATGALFGTTGWRHTVLR